MNQHEDETWIEIAVTPVERVDALGLSIKRDDLTHPLYGGNKPRKLALLLADARARGARRVVTTGAWGSHHALATALFARRLGLRARLLLWPQPRTPHADAVLAASRGTGAEITLVAGLSRVPWRVASGWQRGDAWIPLGGSSPRGALGFVSAAAELAAQIARGEAELPDEIVVATGSGGTAAGLAVGLARAGLPTRVRGATVVSPPGPARASARALVARLASGAAEAWDAERRLTLDESELGAGYGAPTERGLRATEQLARHAGLALDATYTAKAAALALRRAATGARVLYWHTLSAGIGGGGGRPEPLELAK
ncbi:MAG: pyridoxal-phosphate dependent enzyme [Polyangiaceae bacterium]|nr:pyridoxal-phosphate dependent enzyme [Polyangiaceae bacterium]